MIADISEVKDLLVSLRVAYGYDFTGYAEASMKRRIVHFMTLHKVDNVSELKRLLLSDEKFFELLVQEIPVTVTEMFRDPSFFLVIRNDIVKRLATYPFIKIWIAGCATGEEVYSIAILLKEEGLLERTVIYATDINQRSIQIAKEGIYSVARMKDYTSNYHKSGGKAEFSSYYKTKYDAVMLDRSLREHIVFSSHNLATDFSFGEFQLIICRNVLIYFNQDLQRRVMSLFYQSLCAFGYMGLGSKESLLSSDKKDSFVDIDKKEKIYMKAK